MEEMNKYLIRPYARLLTMLGDQLIKDERIALVEIIKNSYDADSDWVKIIFQDFDEDYKKREDSKIVIQDAGYGMSIDVIKKHWLNPATPYKAHKRGIDEKTPKGRIIQGEKGIGRFALFKLGKKIKIITRAKNENLEHVIEYDFSRYDNDFLVENGIEKDLFLDELSVTIKSREPILFQERKLQLGTGELLAPNYGTNIEISDLKGAWTETKVKNIYNDILRLEPIFSDITGDITSNFVPKKKFSVYFYLNKKCQYFEEKYIEKLNYLLQEKSVIRIKNGLFDDQKLKFSYCLNDSLFEIDLKDPQITGLMVFKKRFGERGKNLDSRKIECGPFRFGFYVFDFGHNPPAKYVLDKEDKEIIKPHRIYLYRDGIRVYPYGEQDDDWLKIDQYRGTIAAGYFLSNDQVVGYVNISWKENPNLRDKTNREGLIDEGNATEDFLTLIQVFLAYIRKGPYTRYLKDNESKNDAEIFKNDLVEKGLIQLKNEIKDSHIITKISSLEKQYKSERAFLVRRAEITESLAGVGISVETASHDILGIMSKVFVNIDGLIRDLSNSNEINIDEVIHELQSIRGGMSFIEAQLKDIQLLFTSSKQKRRAIRVQEIIEKVERIYKRTLQKDSIEFSLNTYGSPLYAKATDAVLLQLMLNLFDNSIYWLQQIAIRDKKIEITLDGQKGIMVFSDNGPGVREDDMPYIFEPFYSGKGEEGRGLGLYIARQLLERNDYTIELAQLKSEKLLPGANFVINFVGGEENGHN